MAGRAPRGGQRPSGGRPGGGRSSSGRPTGGRRNPGRTDTAAVRNARGRGGAARTGGTDRGKGLGGQQIEGRQAVRELLLAQTRKVYEISISTDLEGSDSVEDIVTIAAAERVPVQYVARKKLDAAARSEAPQGVIAQAAALRAVPLHELLAQRASGGKGIFLVAVDGVTDPGNLGAITRNCEGAGVDAMVLPRHRSVHVTPTVAKAAAGAVEYVPFSLVSGLPSALAELKEAGVWVIGLDDAADRSIFDIDAGLAESCCIVLGAEGAGLSQLVRKRCDLVVAIPMQGRISSLNVSAAAAVATYEIARHRR